ncbi:MAG: hypothetical protein FJ308_20210 [Planctomycetes bacterium]|nr:hypothetical protein [Planctomycetota bacterium]
MFGVHALILALLNSTPWVALLPLAALLAMFVSVLVAAILHRITGRTLAWSIIVLVAFTIFAVPTSLTQYRKNQQMNDAAERMRIQHQVEQSDQ